VQRNQDDNEWTPVDRVVLAIESNVSAPPRGTTRVINPAPIIQQQQQPPPQQPDLSHLMYRDINPEDYEALLQLDEGESNTKGVPALGIDSIPTDTVQPGTVFDDCCSICLEEMTVGEQVKKLPNCSHLFHKVCIDMWLNRSNNCAVCNCQVFDNIDEIREQERMLSDQQVVVLPPRGSTRVIDPAPIIQQPPQQNTRARASSLSRVRSTSSVRSGASRVTTQQPPSLGSTSSSHFQVLTNDERERNLQTIRRKLQLRKMGKLGSQNSTIRASSEPTAQVMGLTGMGFGGSIISEQQSTQSYPNIIRGRKRPKSPSSTALSRRKEEVVIQPQFDLTGVQIHGNDSDRQSEISDQGRTRSVSGGKLVKGSLRKENVDRVDHNLDLIGAEIGAGSSKNMAKGKQIKGVILARKPLQDDNSQSSPNLEMIGDNIGVPSSSGPDRFVSNSTRQKSVTKTSRPPSTEIKEEIVGLIGIEIGSALNRGSSSAAFKGKKIIGSMIPKAAKDESKTNQHLSVDLARDTNTKAPVPKGKQIKGNVSRRAKQDVSNLQTAPSLELMGTNLPNV
jgi:hypothetical protein